MRKLLNKILSMASVVCTMLAITACHNTEITEEKEDWSKPADHTLLMYEVGDNNLSSLLETNIRDAQSALLSDVKAGTINLVVMKDNNKANDDLPVLYWVRRKADAKLDTVIIQKWDTDINTASPEVLKEVLNMTFSRFNTTLKGLVLGSHGTGWVPLTNNNNFSAPRRAFGYDDKPSPIGSIELWDLAEAIQGGSKLDYILMDCCHMATIEVAYELRKAADYMVACPTEEEGVGIPYKKVLPILSQCRSANDLSDALDNTAKSYFEAQSRFSEGATISLINLKQIDNLATAIQRLLALNAERLNQFETASGEEIDQWLTNFQCYGREVAGLHNAYYFHDILSVIEWLADGNATAAQEATQALTKAVIAEYHTSVYRDIPITKCSGMAMTLPQVLHLAGLRNYLNHFTPFSDAKLKAAYRHTAWGKLTGY